MQTRQFNLGDVLSITTGRLLSDRHMEGIYDILNFMTGDSLFTHQLPRARSECIPYLLKQHPDLGSSEIEKALTVLDRNLDGIEDNDARGLVIDNWLENQQKKYGKMLDVMKIPSNAHETKDPIEEAVEMKGGSDEVLVAITD